MPSGSPPKRRRLVLPYSTRPAFRVDLNSSATLPGPNPISTLHPLLPAPTVSAPALAPNQKAAWDAQKRLIDDFAERKAADISFPPLLDDFTTRQAIDRFQQHTRHVAESTTRVCASCGGFITSTPKTLAKTSELYRESISVGVFKEADLDVCGLDNEEFSFCKLCFDQIRRSKPPRFGSINEVNVLPCQRFPEELKDLTLVEEAVIARAHPIISILKLRPKGASPFVSYQRIRGHAVVLPQNPGPLLNILPSRDLALHDVVRVVWAGDRRHTAADICPFVSIRRNKVLQALQWLKTHNLIYRDIVVNYELLDEWEDQFIPEEIASTVLHADPDHAEREGYAADIEAGNYEDDFHHAVEEAGLGEESSAISGCLYSDTNQTRDHPILKLVSAIANHKRPQNGQESDLPSVTYRSLGNVAPLNDWDNPQYFTAAFPVLFPFGVGGHISIQNRSKNMALSLQTWAKWAMTHHSRRFARHPTFMFLIYDVIIRRNASLGYSMLIKSTLWDQTHAEVDAITPQQLEAAIEEIKRTGKYSDPVILKLERQVQVVAKKAPHSFAKCAEQATHIKALMVSNGMPAFWITLNPSDLRSNLVLTLAGVEYESERLPNSAETMRIATATMNPVAVAQFFDATCTAIFQHLLHGGKGLLGPISTYFGTVETNGQGMLHLHCLVWLQGATHAKRLRVKLLSDPEFATRMVDYMDQVIKCSLTVPEDRTGDVDIEGPSASSPETDVEFARKLFEDSNIVASKRQIHSSKHNATCYKYGAAATGVCRFDFPRPCVEKTAVTERGTIEMYRNHVWINPWCPAFASLIRSNHDINFILSNVKALALIRYITNYATKGDCSQYQRLLAALLVRKSSESGAASGPHTTNSLCMVRMDKFALRAFNRLAHDREISGPLAASSLLSLPEYYTPTPSNGQVWLRRVSLQAIRNRFPKLLFPDIQTNSETEDLIAFSHSRERPSTMFDNYEWRGLMLAQYSLYDYFKLIDIVRGRQKEGNIPFHEGHPRADSGGQRLITTPLSHTLVSLVGPLSTNETAENAVREGHPETDARENDVAMILLGLFVPWGQLESKFSARGATKENFHAFCWEIWEKTVPELSEYTKYLSDNVLQMRKGQIECKINQEERQLARGNALLTTSELEMLARSDGDEPTSDDGDKEDQLDQLGLLTIADLMLGLSAAKRRWRENDKADSEGLSAASFLHDLFRMDSTIFEADFLNIYDNTSNEYQPSGDQTGVRLDIEKPTVDLWESLKKSAATPEDNETDENPAGPHHLSEESSIALEPMLGMLSSESEVDFLLCTDCRMISDQIHARLPLNHLQRLTVEEVLSHAIGNAGKRCIRIEDQLLLYIRGEGGVGKSRVVKAIELGFSLLKRRKELVITAPTGNAASHIGGSTIHTALGIPIQGTVTAKVLASVTRRWTQPSTLIIDEISMVSLKLFASINDQLGSARGSDTGSTAIFGGLPLVILMGDFFQFPPVTGQPLWGKAVTDEEKRAQALWERYGSVITLTEQMRQRTDQEFHTLLQRARKGELNIDDVRTLNRQVATQFPATNSLKNVVVAQRNKLRHMTNREQTKRFVEMAGQYHFLFPADDSRIKRRQKLMVRVEDLLTIQDGDGSCNGPGLLSYAKGMPVAVLANQCTPLGIVNGAKAIMHSVVPHDRTTWRWIDERTILASHPALCILIEKETRSEEVFPGLANNIFPVFPHKSTVSVGEIRGARWQIPMTPAFSLTEYKIQGETFETAVLDLRRRNASTTPGAAHKRFCSTYTQLSRLQTLKGVQLLEPIRLSDIGNKPSELLLQETARLDRLSDQTLATWTARFNQRRSRSGN